MICKILLVLSVLLMPFGMAPAPAAAHVQVAGAMGHCPDEERGRHANGGIEACSMACAAALPPSDFTQADGVAPVERAPVRPALSQRLHGLHPETATPPPRLS